MIFSEGSSIEIVEKISGYWNIRGKTKDGQGEAQMMLQGGEITFFFLQ